MKIETREPRTVSDRLTPAQLPKTVDLQTTADALPSWRPSWRIRALVIVNLGAAAFYLGWWLTPGHVGTPILFVLLAIAETFNLFHLLGLWWTVWATKVAPPPPRRTSFSVDVFVATYGEPLDILEQTILATVGLAEQHRTFVLDDAARPEVEQLARRLGAEYVARRRRRGAKAGNLNNALAQTTGDLVAVFDADHVPRPDFLTRVLGYFEDPRLAFVQTPQFYGNAARNDVAKGAYQQQAIFYGPICRGKNGLDSAFCCGTNVVFRRDALEDVGGFDEKSVVEDFVTSMRIHRRGWTSLYYPYVLAQGLGPETLYSYFRQQFRWARGSVGALTSLEPFRKGFKLRQRLQYLLATTFYLTGLVTPIYVLLPILYLLGGWTAFSNSSGNFVFFYAPYLMLGLLTIRWGLGGQLSLAHLRYTFGAFPVYAAASLAALVHLPARFRVTEKGDAGPTKIPRLALVSVAAFVTTLIAIELGPFLQPLDARTATNMSWGVANLLLLWGIVGATHRDYLRGRRLRRHARANGKAPFDQRSAPEHHGARLGSSWFSSAKVLSAGHVVLPEFALERRPWSLQHTFEKARSAALHVGIITGLGLGLRLSLIDAQSLRLDESLSLQQAKLGLVDLWTHLVTENVHVPLYHTLLHFWIQVAGTSEAALRFPSVFFGTLAIPMLYLVGSRLVGQRPAVFAAAIAAGSPFWVWHSDEARMYPLLLFLVLATLYLLIEAVARGQFWRWGIYAVAMGVTFYAHYFALLMVVVHTAYLLTHRVPRRKLAAWLGATSFAGLMFAPWVIALFTLRLTAEGGGASSLTNGIRVEAPDYTVFGVAYTFIVFFMVYIVGYHGAATLGVLGGLVVGAWPLVALRVAVSQRLFAWLRSETSMFFLAWLVLTVGLVFLVNFWMPGLFFQKYLIAASPPLFLMIGLALCTVFRQRMLALTAVFLALAPGAVISNVERGNPVREDFRTAVQIVNRGVEPGDAVLVLPVFNSQPFEYYYRGPARVYPILSPEVPPDVTIAVTIPKIAAAHRGVSLWVVMQYERSFDYDGAVPAYLDRTFERTRVFRLGENLEVRRYRVPRRFRVD